MDHPPGTQVERLFARIGEVSSLPHVAMEIIELAGDPSAEADDLLEAVRRDPALAMRLMRTINSSYYALSEKVVDLKQAITLLGFKEVRNLAMTAYIAQLFRETSDYGTYSRRGLWNHMVATAMVARLTAQTCGKVQPQEAYLAGLLHDVGFILIDQYLHKPFTQVLDALTEQSPVCGVESKFLGFDHAALGEYVAIRWRLPAHVAATIGYHHTPAAYDGPHADMVNVVALADCLCHLKGLTALGIGNVPMPSARLFAELGLQRQHLSSIVERLDEALAAADTMALVQVR
ncbi:MAG: HDOD domain-containing protein [Thermoguttaceae bacterium]